MADERREDSDGEKVADDDVADLDEDSSENHLHLRLDTNDDDDLDAGK